MASYILGDVQGCFKTFRALLKKFKFHPENDTLFLLGDLVNRGPDSLGTLRWMYEHRDAITAVLGNHDCLLLHCAWNGAPLRKSDTLSDILRARDADKLVGWVSSLPTVVEEDRFIMVHAGFHPKWTWSQIQELSQGISEKLQGDGKEAFIARAFELKSSQWSEGFERDRQLVTALNVFTRNRACDKDGNIDFSFKRGLEDMESGLYPWFAVPGRKGPTQQIYFGHWSAIGIHAEKNAHCLDSGCVWGRELTALRVEDNRLFQQHNVD